VHAQGRAVKHACAWQRGAEPLSAIACPRPVLYSAASNGTVSRRKQAVCQSAQHTSHTRCTTGVLWTMPLASMEAAGAATLTRDHEVFDGW
jgi:hypothetical protein